MSSSGHPMALAQLRTTCVLSIDTKGRIGLKGEYDKALTGEYIERDYLVFYRWLPSKQCTPCPIGLE
jgi:hypothetical protein